MSTVAWAQRLWQPDTVYLNTASYGLPPAPAWEALQSALADWRGGRTSWEQWGEATTAARREFALLVGAQPADVAIGATVSGLVGTIAASLPQAARVLAPDGEFTSLIFPFMAAGADVRLVPLERLADAVDRRTDVLAFSAVQSASGALAALPDIAAAAREHGALTVVDATQACGWLPLTAVDCDALVCGAYKWLVSPRGTAFMVVREALAERLVPFQAGWFAGAEVHDSYYGAPLRLANDARRFDTSPAWFSWVGTAPALAVVNRLTIEAIHAHDVRLANRFRAGLGLPAGDSAIVSAEVPRADERLAHAGIQAAVRAGRLRASFHVYNTDADVDAALEALVQPASPARSASKPG
jgi:selenocysteine lyase/cysteine desulfurase